MSRRVGVWLVGARGGVSTTVAIGLAALQQSLTETTGLVSAIEPFASLELVDWENIVIGGHDIRDTSLSAEGQILADARVLDQRLLEQCREQLDAFDANVRPGVLLNSGRAIAELAEDGFVFNAATPRDAIEQIGQDLATFAAENKCERVIVVNLASTEPTFDVAQCPADWATLETRLTASDFELPPSALYAIAAIDAGHPFINFTPSIGNALPAIVQLAEQRGVCHVGRDGKTGETLLKSVLAPAFAHRNLEIMSWVGHNIFGNLDGRVLDDPANKQTKVTSKDQLLSTILGYAPQSHISIEYIRSLGDWKTAWDHIHFKGFLGTPMTMQFTWQGCDSILAAPLVLDLIRFTDLSATRGETGLLTHLASFFKSPLGTDENNFHLQFELLRAWAEKAA